MVAPSVGLDRRHKVHSSACFMCQKHFCAAFKQKMMAFSVPQQNDFRHARRAAPCSIFSKPDQTKHISFKIFQYNTRIFAHLPNTHSFFENILKQHVFFNRNYLNKNKQVFWCAISNTKLIFALKYIRKSEFWRGAEHAITLFSQAAKTFFGRTGHPTNDTLRAVRPPTL